MGFGTHFKDQRWPACRRRGWFAVVYYFWLCRARMCAAVMRCGWVCASGLCQWFVCQWFVLCQCPAVCDGALWCGLFLSLSFVVEGLRLFVRDGGGCLFKSPPMDLCTHAPPLEFLWSGPFRGSKYSTCACSSKVLEEGSNCGIWEAL